MSRNVHNPHRARLMSLCQKEQASRHPNSPGHPSSARHPELVSGAIQTEEPFASLNPYLKSTWFSNSPKIFGSFAYPGNLLDPDSFDDASNAKHYTLNDQIPRMNGEYQSWCIQILSPGLIPSSIRKKSRASVIKWALDGGYELADVRVAQYVADNPEEQESIFPEFREIALRDYPVTQSAHFVLAGSVIYDVNGVAHYPMIYNSRIGIKNALYGGMVRAPWRDDEYLIHIVDLPF